MIEPLKDALNKARTDFQFRVPEGIAKHGDSARMYHNKRSYRVSIVFVVEEEKQ